MTSRTKGRKGRWTEAEDAFLLEHCDVGIECIASVDLGRSKASVSARLKKLIDSGAAASFATAMANLIRYRFLSGKVTSAFEYDFGSEVLEYWEQKSSEWGGKK